MHRLTSFSLDHPKLTFAILAIVTIVLGIAAPQVKPAYGYRVLIGDDHPAIRELDGFIERFGGGLPVVIAWECGPGKPCASALDRASLDMASEVTLELNRTRGILRAEGISNAALLVPEVGGFAVRRLVENGEVPADIDVLREHALNDSLWRGSLISTDGSVGTIIVQPTDTARETDLFVTDAIEAALEPFEESGFAFYITGNPVGHVIAGRSLTKSTNQLVPYTVVIIALILLALSRSISQTLSCLASMGVAVVWTLGIMGWLGWPQDGIHEVLVPLILVVGVCDAIHLLSRYAELSQERGPTASVEERAELLNEVSREMSAPCLVTTLTTAGAFASFTTSALDTFFRFGIVAAAGVLSCLVVTFSLLPLIASRLPAKAPGQRATRWWTGAVRSLLSTSRSRAKSVLLISAIALAAFGTGWHNYLEVDNDWDELLGSESIVAQSVRFVESHLGPGRNLELEITLPTDTAAEAPATLRIVEDLSRGLTAVEGLGRAKSVVDLVRRLNRLVHDDDAEFDAIGSTTRANAELLELIEIQDPATLSSWLSLDRTSMRISVDAQEQSYAETAATLRDVREAMSRTLPASWDTRLSGFTIINNDWIRDVQETQLRSFPVALLIVFLLVSVFMRSLALGLAALIPAVLPVVVTLGTMAFIGLSLDVGRAMIAAVLLGIAVDDSVHILSRYKFQRKIGDNPSDAIWNATQYTARAVITTSLALSFGFLTLSMSAWQSISSFGFFVSIGIFSALLSALLVLPALIFAVSGDD